VKLFTSKQALLIIGDIIITIVSVYTAVYIRFNGHSNLPDEYSSIIFKAIMFSTLMVFMCFFVDLYSKENGIGRKAKFLKILFAGFFAAVTLAAIYYFAPSLELGRGILFLTLCISIFAQSVWHIGYSLFLKLPVVANRVLILGTGPVAENMGKTLDANRNDFALAGYVNCIGEPVNVPRGSIVGNGDGLFATALKEKAHKIVVSLSERRGTLPVREVLDCKLNGIDVVDGPSFYEQVTGRLLIESMNPSHLIFSDGFKLNVFSRYIKRLFDIFFASVGIILSFPLFVIIPVLIKIDSRGMVLFKQRRIGEGEKYFTVYKFRTMIDGAEKASGPVWSQTGDKRITRLGKLLRKTRLDELPQLFNVLHGNMSFIGPRPERPFFVESLKKQIPYYSERHCLKPGITGWAQVRYEYGDSIEDAIEKLRYDLYYIKYQSISLDFLIVLDTIKVVLFGRGGR
jgi:sugar transferase (PEP-CTERM system associated)